jgi:hypothetical protein
MQKALLGLLLLVLNLSLCGCREKEQPAPIFTGDPIPPLIKGLDSPSPMGRLFSVKRLGELGAQSQPALPALRAFARKHPEMRKEAEEAIAKITKAAPAPPR